MSEAAQSIISLLLKKKPFERLGSKGTEEIKKHEFFKDIDFSKLLKKEVEPPFIPQIVKIFF